MSDAGPLLPSMSDATRLRDAWFRVKAASGAPGPDGVTVAAYGSRLDANLDVLSAKLRTGPYMPGPVRRVRIPKADGGHRILGVPGVEDRVAQNAAALVLQDLLHAVFSDASYAYRPQLGPRRAADRLGSLVSPDSWVVLADIEKFFDNVEHAILMRQLAGAGVDGAGLELLRRWLVTLAVDRDAWYQPVKGLPQGSPIAPVLANLYLTGFDRTIEGAGLCHVRYADDFVVVVRSQAQAEEALALIATHLKDELRLAIKDAKTLYTPARDGFTFVGFWFDGASRRLPEAKYANFQASIRGLLEPGGSGFVGALKAHNDLVRGWRAYYGNVNAAIDAQLADLDRWRQQACERYVASAGLEPDVALVCFEPLVRSARPVALPGGYPEWETQPSDEPGVPASYADHWRGSPAALAPPSAAFSTTKGLRSAAIAERQSPVLFDRGELRVPTHGAFVTRAGSTIVVRRKKQTVFECALDRIDSLAVEGEGVVLSTTLVRDCVARNISVILCTRAGVPFARLAPAKAHRRSDAISRQIAARQSVIGMRIARGIVSGKIANQRALLLYHRKYARRAATTRELLESAAARLGQFGRACLALPEAALPEIRSALFLLEARAAAWYWRGIAGLVPPSLGFSRRRGRGAQDVVNKLLNYGYALLQSRVWRAIEEAALEPRIGLLHVGPRAHPGLVFDLMEEFRQPVVDRATLGLVGRGARMELNAAGELPLRVRLLMINAVDCRLRRPAHRESPQAMSERIGTQARRLNAALHGQGEYVPYRMTW